MYKIANSLEMKTADRYTIEQVGVPSEELMLRAASRCVKAVTERFDKGTSVLVLCGSGNNGGDGFAAAYLLHDEGYHVDICYPGDPSRCTTECASMMEQAAERGIAIYKDPQILNDRQYDVCLDALFGIGLMREVGGVYEEIIKTANAMDTYRIAVDISSGISADSGQVLGIAFQADLTVTFAYAKPGHYLYPGRNYTGELVICDIGIYGDPEARKQFTSVYEEADLKQLLPCRPADSHKGTYGKLLVIAGTEGMAGAAYFSALAAYRCGAGLVQIFTHEANRIPLQTLLPEAILTTYREEREAIRKLEHLLGWCDAIVCGPGLGTENTSVLLTEYALEHRRVPMILDADAINLIGKKNMRLLPERSALVLTPHLKEFSRLNGRSVKEIKQDLIRCAKEYAVSNHVTLVCKDAVTCIASPDGCDDVLNLTGSPVMAKGGSGDVLTGVIGALICQKTDPSKAASMGVWIHGKAGESLESVMGVYGGLARELADHTALVMKMLKGL